MDSGYRASRCRRYHGAAYGPHRFSLFTWASACSCTCTLLESEVFFMKMRKKKLARCP